MKDDKSSIIIAADLKGLSILFRLTIKTEESSSEVVNWIFSAETFQVSQNMEGPDVPFTIQRSTVPFPHKILGHVALTWRNAIIVWGGWGRFHQLKDLSKVYYHKQGQWLKMMTTGDIPYTYKGERTTQVLNDKMYMITENISNRSVVHCLDLISMIWTEITPSGQSAPSPGTSGSATWIYNGNIYLFTGNAIYCYNVSKNTWERPKVVGNIPSPRRLSSIIISDDTVFLFGGLTEDGDGLGDLHILNMLSMRWKQVHGRMRQPNSNFTLTRVSKSAAKLFGMLGDDEECWLLNLNHAKELHDPSAIWTRIPSTFARGHHCHCAVLEPISQRLWLIGGYDDHGITSDVLKLSLKFLPLKDLAKDRAAHSIGANDLRLLPGHYPDTLKYEIEEYRSKWIFS